MRTLAFMAMAVAIFPLAGCGPEPSAAGHQATPGARDYTVAEPVAGRTEPVPGRKAVIAPVVLHPVVEVMVAEGDSVKRDQPLVRLDADEPQADVRAKQAVLAELQASLGRLKEQPREAERAEARAILDGVRLNLKEARRRLEQIEPLRARGAISERSHHDAELAVRRGEADERAALAKLEQHLRRPLQWEAAELEAKIAAAQSGVEAARAELEHYTVRAAIAGVISRLDVHSGAVSRPGNSVWGEILDLREIDVLCEVAPVEAFRLAVGRPAEVREEGALDGPWTARVVSVGIAADPHSGRVPVRLRLGNTQRRLRCYVPVTVQFHAEPTLAGRR